MVDRIRIIYRERNGEVVIYDADGFYVFKKSRDRLSELISYKMDESPTGYFRVTLYYDEMERKAYREWLWIPSFGYSWSEYKIDILEP
jgi:hypothetical protein